LRESLGGGEGGPDTMGFALGEIKCLRRSLPFDGRIRTVWFLAAAVVTGLMVALLALTPLR
jgi:hypothetical protein